MSPAATHEAALDWLELVCDYRCNHRCVGCFAVRDDGPRLRTSDAFTALAQGRRDGARFLWLGGGEPTLRPDLAAIIAEARRLGYERIKLQTNGVVLSYAELCGRWRSAGLTEVAFGLRSADAAMHDALTRTPGAFALLCSGIENARDAGLELEGDVLLSRPNVGGLADTLAAFEAKGLRRFRVWTLAASHAAEPDVEAAVPPLAEVVAALGAAAARFPDRGAAFLVSLHTPACTLPPPLRNLAFDARALRLVVVNPSEVGGPGALHRFRLEDSPMEGGTFLEGCARCALRSRCNGVRAETLAREGAAPFAPIEP